MARVPHLARAATLAALLAVIVLTLAPLAGAETQRAEHDYSRVYPCFGHGTVHNSSWTNYEPTCLCYHGFATYDAGEPCNYRLKTRQQAFVFSTLYPYLGLDHFYLGNNAIATVKMLTGLGVIGDYVYWHFRERFALLPRPYSHRVWVCALRLAALAWHITDLTLIGTGYYHDGLGMPMEKWYFGTRTVAEEPWSAPITAEMFAAWSNVHPE